MPAARATARQFFLEPASFEWLPGAAVFDYRSNSLVWRHTLQLGQRERVELKINAGLLAGLGRVLDQHIIANVLPQETIRPAEAGAPFQIGQPLADHIDLPQRLRIAVPVRGRVLVGLVHALLR